MRNACLPSTECGRQSDALVEYRKLHKLLDAELGIEPSPPLQQLHRAILAHDADTGLVTAGRIFGGGPAEQRDGRRRTGSVRAAHRAGPGPAPTPYGASVAAVFLESSLAAPGPPSGPLLAPDRRRGRGGRCPPPFTPAIEPDQHCRPTALVPGTARTAKVCNDADHRRAEPGWPRLWRRRALGDEHHGRHRVAHRPGAATPSCRRFTSEPRPSPSRVTGAAACGSPTAGTAPCQGINAASNTVVEHGRSREPSQRPSPADPAGCGWPTVVTAPCNASTRPPGNVEQAGFRSATGPAGIAVEPERAVWVANSGDGTVSKVDPITGQTGSPSSRSVPAPGGSRSPPAAVWVANSLELTVSPASTRSTDQVVGHRPGRGWAELRLAADSKATSGLATNTTSKHRPSQPCHQPRGAQDRGSRGRTARDLPLIGSTIWLATRLIHRVQVTVGGSLTHVSQ